MDIPKHLTLKRAMSHAGYVPIVDFMQVYEQVRWRLQGLKVSGAWWIGTYFKLFQGSVALSLPCSFVPFSLWELVGG